MTNPVDSSGNVQVAFEWGNLPIQPDDVRQTSPSQTVSVSPSQNHGWTVYGTLASAKLSSDPTTVNLNGLTWFVNPGINSIATSGTSGYPAFTSPVTEPGVGYVTAPEVVGLSLSAASTKIVAAGLVVGTVTTENNASGATLANNGTVEYELPVAGADLVIGSSVNLREYIYQLAVPNVVGNTEPAAATALSALGFTVTTSLGATATVATQTPASGTTANYGSAVTLA
jgi:hypothetical protein